MSGVIDPDPIKQYCYHPAYIDAPVAVWHDPDVDGAGITRYHFLHDANFNVTAITDSVYSAFNVVERYSYSPYGVVTVLNGASEADGAVADFSADANNTSDIGNEFLYTGRRLDPETGLQINRRRYYHQQLGRWLTRDPIGYWGGMNLYGYVGGMPTNYVDPYGLFNWFSGWWGIGGPSDEELRDQEQNTVNFLNQRLGTDHHYISQFTPSERAQIESQLGRRIVWPESAESAIRAGYSERVGFSDASHASLKVSERANQAAGVVAGAGSLKQIGTNVIEEVVGVPNPKDLVDAAKGLRKAADDIPCPPKTDYVVTPDGTAIPTDKNELLDNLSKLDDQSTKPGTSRKLVGEDSQGPIRVRIEKPHGTDPNYTGSIDPLHDVDHMHIERRRNGTSGPWTDRRGGGRKEKVPIEWPFEE